MVTTLVPVSMDYGRRLGHTITHGTQMVSMSTSFTLSRIMLQEPPLSEPALVLWKTYIAEWTHPHRRTRKREAAEALTNFVTVLLSSGARARDDFARWLFSSVVDYHADLPIQSQLVEEVLAPYVSRTIEQSGDSEDIVTVAL